MGTPIRRRTSCRTATTATTPCTRIRPTAPAGSPQSQASSRRTPSAHPPCSSASTAARSASTWGHRAARDSSTSPRCGFRSRRRSSPDWPLPPVPATFDAVAAALRERGFTVAPNDAGVDQLTALSENFLVWLDGPGPARSCGQGTALLDSTRSETNLNNLGGKLAVIFRDGARLLRRGRGPARDRTQPRRAAAGCTKHHRRRPLQRRLRGHDVRLGGAEAGRRSVQRASTSTTATTTTGIRPQGAPLGWWTLNLSRFLCPDAHCNRPAEARAEVALRAPSADDQAPRGQGPARAREAPARASAAAPAARAPGKAPVRATRRALPAREGSLEVTCRRDPGSLRGSGSRPGHRARAR